MSTKRIKKMTSPVTRKDLVMLNNYCCVTINIKDNISTAFVARATLVTTFFVPVVGFEPST